MTTKGCTRYGEPNMAHTSPSTTQTDTMSWERRMCVDRVASLSNFRDHMPRDIRAPDNQRPPPST